MELEEKAIRVLAATAVFWSFFIATAIGTNAMQDMFAYANEPFAQAQAIERQAAAMEAMRTAQARPSRPVMPPLPPQQAQGGIESRAASTTDPDSDPHKRHCPRPSQSLARGGQNMPEDVKALQQFLADRYAQKKEDMVTGHFGPLTEKLLARFQEEQGLPPVGTVGPLTRAALARACGGDTTGGTGTASTTSPVETTLPQTDTQDGTTSAPKISLERPKQGAVYDANSKMIVSWRTANVAKTMNVRITTTLLEVSPDNTGYISGGSAQKTIEAGSKEGSYTIDWGLNDTVTGTYQVAVQLEECAAQGCQYYYGPTTVLAKAKPVTITVE